MITMTQEEKMLIANRIKEIREANGASLETIGKIMEITRATASRYESGEVENIPLPRIKALANEYGVNPAWILGLSDKKYREEE